MSPLHPFSTSGVALIAIKCDYVTPSHSPALLVTATGQFKSIQIKTLSPESSAHCVSISQL